MATSGLRTHELVQNEILSCVQDFFFKPNYRPVLNGEGTMLREGQCEEGTLDTRGGREALGVHRTAWNRQLENASQKGW